MERLGEEEIALMEDAGDDKRGSLSSYPVRKMGVGSSCQRFAGTGIAGPGGRRDLNRDIKSGRTGR